MNNDFNKFKKKLMVEHLVKSILFGVAAGLAGAGLSLVVFGLTGTDFIAWVHILIGVVLAAATFGLLYIYKRPDDKKIAARLDKDMHLQEKLSTMVQFQNQESLLINKQRDDANEKLAFKNPKQVPFKLAVLNIPILAVAGALFAGSFFSPAVAKALGIVDDPTKTDLDGTDLNERTEEIAKDAKDALEESQADEDLKEEMNDIMDELVEDLEDDNDIDSRTEKIEDAKSAVDEALDRANSKEEIGESLSGNATNEALKDLGEAIQNGDTEAVSEALKALEEQLAAAEGQEKVDLMNQIADEIEKALAESGISEDDPLYQALKDLANDMRENAAALQEQLNSDEQKALEEAAEQAQQAAEDAQAAAEAAQQAAEEAQQNAEANPSDASAQQAAQDAQAAAEAAQQAAQDAQQAAQQAQQAASESSDNAQKQAKEDLEEADKMINEELDQQNANEEEAEQFKQAMDEMVDPEEEEDEFDAEKDEKEKEDEKQEEQDQEQTDDKQEQTDDKQEQSDDKQEQSDDQQSGQQQGQQQQPGQQQGSQSGQGQGGTGAGAGSGQFTYGSNDGVYTEDGGQNLTDNNNIEDGQAGALTDASESGDESGDISDYFDNLYNP